MQSAPLAQDLAKRPRVDDLVHRNAGAFVAGDVADAVATGLDAMHVHTGQQVHHVSAFGQGNPVELGVLPGGEVGIAGGQVRCAQLALGLAGSLVHLRLGLVVVARDGGQHPQLGAGQLAVGHRHPQHGRVALHIPAVLQAQRFEIIVTQLAG